MIDYNSIDSSWTLFLDRDGVINVEKVGDYITRKEDFHFYDGVLDALKKLSGKFGTIVITTNQRCVSKGLMTEQELRDIHAYMMAQIKTAGGRVDNIYYCIDEGMNRKPSPGMAIQAKTDHPAIDFDKSVMIGNTMGDMFFGKGVGMKTIFISSNRKPPVLPDPATDVVYPSLEAAAVAIVDNTSAIHR